MSKEGGDARPSSPNNNDGPQPQQFTPVNTNNLQRPQTDNSSSNGHAPQTPLAPMRNPGAMFGGSAATPARTSTPAPPPPSMAYTAGSSSSITTSPHAQHQSIISQPPVTPNNNGYAHQYRQQSPSPPLVPPPTDENWGSIPDISDSGHKRKRSVSPVTQTQHHHLAAHEAAMGPLPPMPEHPLVRIDSGMTGSDDGSVRGMSIDDGSPHPQSLQVDPHTGVRVDPKRRKRVFSNRTKTGCITCRRRKKKCDEGKPECTNCKRGGFVCDGYSGKVSWQKPPGKQLPPPVMTGPPYIQSKEDQPSGTAGSPSHPGHSLPVGTPTASSHRIGMDERAPYHTPGGEQVTASSLAMEAMSPQSAQAYLPLRGDVTPVASSAAPANTDTPTSQHDVTAATPSSSNGQAAFPHTPASGPNAVVRLRSEKEKMLSGQLYHAYAPELVAEREACKAACWRYNNVAANPNYGISEAEKGRMLLDILRPGAKWEVVNTGAAPGTPGAITYMSENGYASDISDVIVDAPFTCSYGYNIVLGTNVFIEAGCLILDSNKVTIKSRTILSPGVQIYAASHPADPRKRNGARGQEVAKPVVIEEDCWLGGNAIVLGGLTIGKGSVVGAGSVVTRDVPPFTIVAGNPARVIKGIYPNGVDM